MGPLVRPKPCWNKSRFIILSLPADPAIAAPVTAAAPLPVASVSVVASSGRISFICN